MKNGNEDVVSESAVSEVLATQEINRWLDSKRIKPKDRERQKAEIEKLIDCVCDGTLVVNEDNTLTQILIFPSGELKELKFKNRINDFEVRPLLKDVAATDMYGQIRAYGAALSDVSKMTIEKLDTEDRKLTRAIALFFM